MAYVKVGPWVNGAVPAINAANLDTMETQYDEAMADAFDGTEVYTGTGLGFKDEDNMASDSAVAVSSQQSIKKYVDDNVYELLDEWLGGTWALANTLALTTVEKVNQVGRGVCEVTSDGSGQADVFTEVVIDGTEVFQWDGNVAGNHTFQYHVSIVVQVHNTAVGNKNCSAGSYYGNFSS